MACVIVRHMNIQCEMVGPALRTENRLQLPGLGALAEDASFNGSTP